jgi:hypothetical protein
VSPRAKTFWRWEGSQRGIGPILSSSHHTQMHEIEILTDSFSTTSFNTTTLRQNYAHHSNLSKFLRVLTNYPLKYAPQSLTIVIQVQNDPLPTRHPNFAPLAPRKTKFSIEHDAPHSTPSRCGFSQSPHVYSFPNEEPAS